MTNGLNWQPKELPLATDLESKAVLKRLPRAHAALAELKGLASTIPNKRILINTLGLQEAKDSSAIENIITTHDDLYKSGLNIETIRSLSATEVQNYINALNTGFELVSEHGLLTSLQNLPILYLSSYIIKNKSEYYRLLQYVRETNSWDDWIIYMVEGIELTAIETIQLIKDIKELMLSFKNKLREEYKFYSQDLLNNLFKHPYTKIEFIVNDLNVSRITAANYLNKMAEDGLLKKEKLGTGNYYINQQLFELLSRR